MPLAGLSIQTEGSVDGLLSVLAVVDVDAGHVGTALGQRVGSSTVVVAELEEVWADADDVVLPLLLLCLLLLLVGYRAYLFYYSVQLGGGQNLGNLTACPGRGRADVALGDGEDGLLSSLGCNEVSNCAVVVNSVNTLVVVENEALDGGAGSLGHKIGFKNFDDTKLTIKLCI